MKIIDIETKEVLYESKGDEEFFVSSAFFKALKAGKIKYMDGRTEEGLSYSEIKTLDLKDKKFDSIFRDIVASEIGKSVIAGKMPLDTIL